MRRLMTTLTVAVCSVAVFAGDRTIEYGSDPVVLTEDATYGRLIVNGDMTVASGVSLTVDTLCVASNIVGTARLLLETGASLTVSGVGVSDCLIGSDGGQAHVELRSGSTFTAPRMHLARGYDVQPAASAPATKVSLVITGANLNLSDKDNGMWVSNEGAWPSGTAYTVPSVEVALNDGGVLKLGRLALGSVRDSRFIFNGGRIAADGSPWKQTMIYASYARPNASNYFISTNGCPVEISLWGDHAALFHGGSAGSSLHFLGDGDVIIDGRTGHAPTASLLGTGFVFFGHRGKIIVRNPMLSVSKSNLLMDSTYNVAHEVVIEKGGRLDLMGTDQSVKSIRVAAWGGLTNSAEAVSTLTVGLENADVIMDARPAFPPRINVNKVGTGKLEMLEGALPSLTVDGCGVKLYGRAESGYRFYKFNVYQTGNTGTANSRLWLGELVYLNGEEDVTRGWKELYYVNTGTRYYNSPSYALDGDLSTYFFDQQAQSYTTVSNIHFELEYPLPRLVTGYKWTYPSCSAMNTPSVNPTSWEVFGSDDNANWESLDYVEYQRAHWSNWTKRPCTIPPPPAYALTLGAGTSFEVVGADVTETVSASSSDITLMKGARVALTEGTKVVRLTLDVDDGRDCTIMGFVPAETGTLVLTGSAGRLPKNLHLLVPGHDGPLPLERWTMTYNGAPLEGMPVLANGKLTWKSTQGLCVVVR